MKDYFPDKAMPKSRPAYEYENPGINRETGEGDTFMEYASAGDLALYLHAKRREARSHNSAATNALVPTLQNMLERFVACFECKVPEHACTGQRRLAEQAS